jgi:chromosome segregation ATPase
LHEAEVRAREALRRGLEETDAGGERRHLALACLTVVADLAASFAPGDGNFATFLISTLSQLVFARESGAAARDDAVLLLDLAALQRREKRELEEQVRLQRESEARLKDELKRSKERIADLTETVALLQKSVSAVSHGRERENFRIAVLQEHIQKHEASAGRVRERMDAKDSELAQLESNLIMAQKRIAELEHERELVALRNSDEERRKAEDKWAREVHAMRVQRDDIAHRARSLQILYDSLLAQVRRAGTASGGAVGAAAASGSELLRPLLTPRPPWRDLHASLLRESDVDVPVLREARTSSTGKASALTQALAMRASRAQRAERELRSALRESEAARAGLEAAAAAKEAAARERRNAHRRGWTAQEPVLATLRA